MADPFAVELPRQMQIGPVDMSGMKYVGRNVASWFQGNPEMEMRKARVNAELAQVQSQIESQKINNDIKAFELRQKMQSDREIAQIHLETGGDPEKVVNFQVKTTNPYTIRALSQMKLGAAKALASGAMAKQETQILSGLSDLLTKGDADSANDAGEIMRGIREQRGIKADHITAYQNAASAFNQRKAVLEATGGTKKFAPSPGEKEDAYLARLIKEGASPESIQIQKDRIAAHSQTPEAKADLAFKTSISKLDATQRKNKRSDLSKKIDDAEAKATFHLKQGDETQSDAFRAMAGSYRRKLAVLEDESGPQESAPEAPANPAAMKAAEANKIASENPGWTRAQVIEEVEKRFAR